jgi:hypothetical protein
MTRPSNTRRPQPPRVPVAPDHVLRRRASFSSSLALGGAFSSPATDPGLDVYGGGAVRCVAALDVLFRMADSRDQRPGSGACGPSVIVDKRCDTGSEIRLAAGNRKEGGLGGNLNSDIVRVRGAGIQGSRDQRLQPLPHVWSCRRPRCLRRGRIGCYVKELMLWGSRPLCLMGVDRGALMKLSCHFGTALEWEWDHFVGSVRVLAGDHC